MDKKTESPKISLPRSGVQREALRAKGQFWTPDWVADFMAAYVLQEKPQKLFDPAVGEGAFFRAGKRYAAMHNLSLALYGRDIDAGVLEQARESGLTVSDLSNIEIKDFIQEPPLDAYPAIIANPPYIRHHRLSAETKQSLQKFAQVATGQRIDGRAGLHVYFLIRALLTLASHGRLAYIVSADICEGVFAEPLWRWISSNYRIEYVVTFASEATPFPGVDTNAIVLLISNEPQQSYFHWVKTCTRESAGIISLFDNTTNRTHHSLEVHRRTLSEGLSTGLSRPPSNDQHQFRLGDFAAVMRGIVTGDNEFFFLTSEQAGQLKIPHTLLKRAVGRTRDVRGDTLTRQDIDRLDAEGRPTWLLSVNGIPNNQLPRAVQEYLQVGEKKGLPQKTLIKTRKPWYRMESRQIPEILFAYLGRRNARFIKNLAGVVPLTCLLCVYSKKSDPEFVERLWNVLSHPDTVANLPKVGKSYGGNAIKVEPRALERLPLPTDLVKAQGLDKYILPKQGKLGF